MSIINQNKTSLKKKEASVCLGFCHGLLSSVLETEAQILPPDLQWVGYFILKIALGKGMVPQLSHKDTNLLGATCRR